MAENSKIEWTHHTFNPWRGCTKVSVGCANCYAETLSGRNPGTLGVWGPNGTRVVASESMWQEPLKWDRKAKEAGERPRVFCASLADVFEDWQGPMLDSRGHVVKVNRHDEREWDWYADTLRVGQNVATMQDVRHRLFELIDATPNLDWLLLTKRPENVVRMMPFNKQPADAPYGGIGEMMKHAMLYRPNVWLGTSVEDQQAADERIPHLLRVPAAVRFLSCEPLLGPVDMSVIKTEQGSECEPLKGIYRIEYHADADSPGGIQEADGGPKIDWVIAGGESGHGARPCDVAWIRSIRDQCQAAGVPVFVKQLGANVGETNPSGDNVRGWGETKVITADDGVRYLLNDKKGGDWHEWPLDLRVREFPKAVS